MSESRRRNHTSAGGVFAIATWLAAAGCGASQGRAAGETEQRAVTSINALRAAEGLAPLERSPALDAVALARAKSVGASAAGDDTPLPRIVAAGCYARFALSHTAKGADEDAALAALLADPLGRTKAMHAALTHVGLGYDPEAGVLVADFAKLAPPLDAAATEAELKKRIDATRVRNSATPLAGDANLDRLAKRVTADYMAGKGTSDALIAAAQKELGGAGFALGRVTIAFQVVSDTIDLTVPERLDDPVLAFLGVGIAQGNLPPHEPGAVALALFVAEPQGAHAEARVRSDLPPPKSTAPGAAGTAKGSIVDQAWVATLTGNHEKAAALFDQAYRNYLTTYRGAEFNEPGRCFVAGYQASF